MAKREDIGVPISEGILRRLTNGARALGDVFFSPGEPPPPQKQETAGRRYDYPMATNATSQPRAYESVSFSDLRTLADVYDPLRLLIETRKDQLAAQSWKIQKRKKEEGNKTEDARAKELTDIFLTPDGLNEWCDWLRLLLEDMLVLDAATIYPRPTLGGKRYLFEPVDGATIKRVIDSTGRTPASPLPAYQQVLKGIVTSNYTIDELVYKPRNIRTNKLYGYSPVEQVVATVQIGMRRQLSQLSYFTDGTVPDAFMGTPDTWTADNIRDFQEYFDAMMRGDQGKRRGVRFVSKEMAASYTEAKAPPLKDMYDEWLMRIICYAFSIDVTPFVAQVNRSVAETTREQALSEGLVPLMNWIRSLLNHLLTKYCEASDYEFIWSDDEASGMSGGNDIQQTALNGTQISSMMAIVTEVAGKNMPIESATAMMRAAFPTVPVELIDEMLTPLKNFEKPEPLVPVLETGAPSNDNLNKPKPTKEGQVVKVQHNDVEPFEIHIHNAQPDVFVEVGATTVNATIGEQPAQSITVPREGNDNE